MSFVHQNMFVLWSNIEIGIWKMDTRNPQQPVSGVRPPASKITCRAHPMVATAPPTFRGFHLPPPARRSLTLLFITAKYNTSYPITLEQPAQLPARSNYGEGRLPLSSNDRQTNPRGAPLPFSPRPPPAPHPNRAQNVIHHRILSICQANLTILFPVEF